MTGIAPPDTSVWWDVDTVTVAALDVLRLTEDDVDADRIRTLVPDAGQRINQFLDQPTPADVILETWTNELVAVVVRLYRAEGSPPASADDFGLSPGYVSSDPMQQSRAALAPYRRRWGVG